MKRLFIAAAMLAAPITLAAPSAAQELPYRNGDFWEVTEVQVNDGSSVTYLDNLATRWKKNMEFAKSKGWIKEYHVLFNLNKRDGEGDVYLVTVFGDYPNAREVEARSRAFDAFTQKTIRQEEQDSGQRATYRKVLGSKLLVEALLK